MGVEMTQVDEASCFLKRKSEPEIGNHIQILESFMKSLPCIRLQMAQNCRMKELNLNHSIVADYGNSKCGRAAISTPFPCSGEARQPEVTIDELLSLHRHSEDYLN
jgi:hypothetical protein